MENNNKLFGICGSSGSGKSFIVKYVLENLGSDNVSVIYQDNYYKKREEQTKDANGNYNFDLPSSFYLDEFIYDLKKIKNGEKVEREEYTFNNPDISPKIISVFPKKIILVEGLFLFNNKEKNYKYKCKNCFFIKIHRFIISLTQFDIYLILLFVKVKLDGK